MKKILLILVVLILSNLAYGQCVCGKLRFAIDDDSSKYQYYKIIGKDKYSINFLSFTDQIHKHVSDSKKNIFKHHSYMVYDKKKGEIVTKTFDKKHFVLLSIDPKKKFIIEIVEKKSKKKMKIIFTKDTIDTSYNILADFVSGKFKVDMADLKSTFQDNYKNEKITYKGSELKAIASDSRRSSNKDWIKIMDMKKFKD